MTLSSFTGLPEIPDNSRATPGLFNARYSILSQNLDQLNTDTSTLSSHVSIFDSGISTRLSAVSSRVSIFDSGISTRLSTVSSRVSTFDSAYSGDIFSNLSGQFINVKNYGSDSSAFQAALHAASALSAVVVVPGGDNPYACASTITPISNTHLLGLGRPVIDVTGSFIDSDATVENFRVSGLHVRGGTGFPFAFDSACDADICVEDIVIDDFGNDAIRFVGAERFEAIRNRISNCSRGIRAVNSSNGLIAENDVSDIGPGTADGQIGILLWGYADVSGTTKACRNVRVVSNSVRSISDNGIRCTAQRYANDGSVAGDVEYVTIVNNSVDSCGVDCYRLQGNFLTVAGNIAIDPTNGGFRTNAANHVEVVGNTVEARNKNPTAGGIDFSLNFEASVATGITVVGNSVKGPFVGGIRACGNSDVTTDGFDCVIANNFIESAGTGSTQQGISVFRWNGAQVRGNVLRDCLAGISLSRVSNALMESNIVSSSSFTALRTALVNSIAARVFVGHNVVSNSTATTDFDASTILMQPEVMDGRFNLYSELGNANLAVIAANGADAVLRLLEGTGADYGGLAVYDGGTNTFDIGTLDSDTTVKALTIARGSDIPATSGATFRITSSQAPSVGTSTGTAGDIMWDGSFVYVCTSTDSWSRATLNTF